MDNKRIILSIDDSPINNKLIEAYFRKDYNIISKDGGLEALKWLKENLPDVILLDVMMPVMDGMDVLEKLQENERLKEIPVIMVTAKTEIETIKTALTKGALDYVKKPIDFTELQSKIMIAFQMNHQKEEISKYKSYFDIHQGMIHAQRIQRSILPDADYFKRMFPKSFIINLPKHIVSGDFYWINQNFQQKNIGVFDCTGHGVPAAMLTMMGQMELHTIFENGNNIQPGQIFSRLSQKFSRLLNTSGDTFTQYDGMDGAFLSIVSQESKIEYAGAKRPLVLIRKGVGQLKIDQELIEAKTSSNDFSLFEITADRTSIGKESEFYEFQTKTITIKPGDRLFIYSDGVTDQLGGSQTKRLKKKEFYNKLIKIQSKSINLQKADLFNWLEEWKEKNEQTDDILMVGIEL